MACQIRPPAAPPPLPPPCGIILPGPVQGPPRRRRGRPPKSTRPPTNPLLPPLPSTTAPPPPSIPGHATSNPAQSSQHHHHQQQQQQHHQQHQQQAGTATAGAAAGAAGDGDGDGDEEGQGQGKRGDGTEQEGESPRKGRGRTPLQTLAAQFVEKQWDKVVVDIDAAAGELDVRKRRVYDITNVLEGLGLMRKTETGRLVWIRPARPRPPTPLDDLDHAAQQEEHQDTECARAELQGLEQEVATLQKIVRDHEDALLCNLNIMQMRLRTAALLVHRPGPPFVLVLVRDDRNALLRALPPRQQDPKQQGGQQQEPQSRAPTPPMFDPAPPMSSSPHLFATISKSPSPPPLFAPDQAPGETQGQDFLPLTESWGP